MHRTLPVLESSFAPKEQFPGRPSASVGPVGRRLRGGLLGLALLLTLLSAGPAPAQPAAEPAPGIVVTVNGSEIRQMSTRKRIKAVAISDPRFVRVVGAPADNTSVYIV